MRKILTLLLLVFTFQATAQSFKSDSLFGINSQIFSLPNGGSTEAHTIFQQPDGKIVLCGYSYDIGCNCFYNLMFRTDACGQVDSSFGLNGLVHHTFDQRNSAYGYTLLPNGKFIAVGTQSDGNSGSQQFPFIARYNADGSPDTTFANKGTNKISNLGPQGFVSVYQLADGKLLCTNGPFMMQFDSTGAVDATFGNNGVIQHNVPEPYRFYYGNSSVLRSDGKIISFSGVYTGVNNDKYVGQLCYDTLGSIDSTFGTNGIAMDYGFVINATEPRLLLQNDDKIIAIRQNIDESAIIVARYNTNGSLDNTFGTNGYLAFPGSAPCRLRYLSSFADNSFLVAYSQNGVPTQFIRISADGALDSSCTLNGSYYFQFDNNNGPSAEVGFSVGAGELVMGGANGGNSHYGSFSLAKFSTTAIVPHITQTGNTLNSNVTAPGATFQWYRDGVMITDGNNSTFQLTETGVFTVEVTNAIGCTRSDMFEVSTLGLKSMSEFESISISPNPTNGILYFTNSIKVKYIANIYDLSGKLILTETMNTNGSTISIADFSKGIYLVQIIQGSQISMHKIVKF